MNIIRDIIELLKIEKGLNIMNQNDDERRDLILKSQEAQGKQSKALELYKSGMSVKEAKFQLSHASPDDSPDKLFIV